MAAREIENNAYAKFWGDKERALCMLWYFLEWSIEDEFHFLFHCPKYSIPREKFYDQIQQTFVDFNQLSYTELIIKLMNSQNFSVYSHLLKFVSLCNDLRTNLLTVVIIALHYYHQL